MIAIAHAHEIPEGEGRSIEIDGKRVALFNIEGTFYAMDGVCLHRGGPVGEGEVDGTIVTCPWHGFQYDVRTGRNMLDPEVGLTPYEVEVRDGVVYVDVG